MNQDELDTLLERYRKAAVRAGEAIEEGRSRVANKAADEIYMIAEMLRASEPGGERVLLSLLDDEHPAVRCSVARDTVAIAPERVVPVLRELVDSPMKMLGFSASIMLEQWETFGQVGPDAPFPPSLLRGDPEDA
ncbi:DUF2019 domain-containing protein [Haliangium sp.]|uniref:DUF2019 domain-containing protein n=1 Tax=Haliangium sp. TaxID=2663208 RepID=UPI003D0B305B